MFRLSPQASVFKTRYRVLLGHMGKQKNLRGPLTEKIATKKKAGRGKINF